MSDMRAEMVKLRILTNKGRYRFAENRMDAPVSLRRQKRETSRSNVMRYSYVKKAVHQTSIRASVLPWPHAHTHPELQWGSMCSRSCRDTSQCHHEVDPIVISTHRL